MANELKPCPFCNSELYECRYDSGGVRFAHEANDCVLSRKFVYPSKIDAWNSRPAAPVEGLETKAYVRSNGDVLEFRDGWLFDDTDPLVTRSQAETIIAAERVWAKKTEDMWLDVEAENTKLQADNTAERAEKKIWMEKAAIEAERVTKLEADNAALTARVRELEETVRDDITFTKGLETQLAAAQIVIKSNGYWSDYQWELREEAKP